MDGQIISENAALLGRLAPAGAVPMLCVDWFWNVVWHADFEAILSYFL